MPDKARKRSTAAAELTSLLEAGDNRAATVRARQVLSDAGASANDHQAARAALERVRPDGAGMVASAAGLLLFAAAALLGLFRA
jgi:hypothetical protein